ncbi:MAG: toxin-antitoxin system HicB family antitoxin [Oscillospiraceae bacterium]|nr:toxin-antitoxin system HicB family antitoxin [Oscillospiraceae bacterium]
MPTHIDHELSISPKERTGSFNVRISPELHKKAVITAMSRQMSLNSFVESSIEKAIGANA